MSGGNSRNATAQDSTTTLSKALPMRMSLSPTKGQPVVRLLVLEAVQHALQSSTVCAAGSKPQKGVRRAVTVGTTPYTAPVTTPHCQPIVLRLLQLLLL